MKRLAGLVLVLPLLAGTPKAPRVKSVIFMLADGVAPEAWPLARWMKPAGQGLQVDGILSGAIRTYGADSMVSDSAPGATAYACGRKAQDKTLAIEPERVTIPGVPPSERPGAPLATLLEGARVTGRATGLVVTCQLPHASPAAFSAHSARRDDYDALALQQVHQGMDVVFGGGTKYFEGPSNGLNLRQILEQRYQAAYVTTAEGMNGLRRTPAWGVFAPVALANDLDRPSQAPEQPTLATMTAKALDLLGTSPKGRDKGFFLFVEGSKIDWSSHDNDPVGVATELLAFDRAVGVARDYVQKHPDTLLVVVSDHANGGLSIGVRGTRYVYSQTPHESLQPLMRCKLTAEGLAKRFLALPEPQRDEAHLHELLAADLQLTGLTEAERGILSAALKASAAAKEGKETDIIRGVGRVVSGRAGLGWTTNGHTGADVYLFSEGKGRLSGLWENTAIGQYVASALGFDLAGLTRRLFAEAGTALRQEGFTVQVTPKAVEVSRDGWVATMPLSERRLILPDGREQALEGLVLATPGTDRIYLPAQAIRLVKQAWTARRPALKRAG